MTQTGNVTLVHKAARKKLKIVGKTKVLKTWEPTALRIDQMTELTRLVLQIYLILSIKDL